MPGRPPTDTGTLLPALTAEIELPARPRRLLPRGAQQSLRRIAEQAAAWEDAGPPSKAREWLLDNFTAVERALRQVRTGLGPSDLRWLPVLAAGPFAAQLRAAAMADGALALAGGTFSPEQLTLVVDHVAKVRDLDQAELWALPNLIRVHALRTLVDHGDALLAATPDEKSSSAVEAAVRTLVAAERWDWLHFVESISTLEETLRSDPAGVYARMDFTSRDHYRHRVVAWSREAGVSEQECAQAAIRLAEQAADRLQLAEGPSDHESPESHVGYYLLDEGASALAARLGLPARSRLVRSATGNSRFAWAYAPAIAVLTAAFLLPLVASAAATGTVLAVVTGMLALFPALTISTSLVHWSVSRTLAPRFLPRYEPERGLPEGSDTLVALPVIVGGAEDADALLAQLELHQAADPDPRFRYALVVDLPDSRQESQASDADVLQRLETGVAALESRYGRNEEDRRFFLLHRRRLWNESEGRFMGWERKRGKLEELSVLLHTGATGTFVGDDPFGVELRSRIKYVLTLDADTTLPPGEGTRLVTCLAHPLNRAVVDPGSRRVHRGYTFAQPRLDEHPASERSTRLRRILAGGAPLDLYHHRVSNAFMDLFGEGLYQGKALFDVKAFVATVTDRIPENALLSHDLLEGALARTAFVGDAFLLEQEPRNFLAHRARMSRWVRGDWQLLPWLFTPRRYGAAGMSTLARWQVFQPVVATLARPAEVVLLAIGWLVPGTDPWAWTGAVLAYEALPDLPEVVDRVARLRGPGSLRSAAQTFTTYLARFVWSVVTLVSGSLVRLRAIGTTLWRLYVTRHGLLQWRTAAGADHAYGTRALGNLVLRKMAGSPLTAAALFIAVALVRPTSLWAALPVLFAWALAPLLAAWTGRVPSGRGPALADADVVRLRGLARETWHFFERFVGPEDNWLPPDHFQEEPFGVIAHRTSPTNIGMYLTSCLTAYDLGYVGFVGLTARVSRTVETLRSMERFRGHLLNWYDTRTLEPLRPRYVSSVDSGGLMACLLTLRQGLLEMRQQRVWRRERWEGLVDTLDALRAALLGERGDPDWDRAGVLLDELRSDIVASLDAEERWPGLLAGLRERRKRLETLLVPLLRHTRAGPATLAALSTWASRFDGDVDALSRDIHLLMPWHRALAEAPRALRRLPAGSSAEASWQHILSLPVSPALAELPTVYEAAKSSVRRLRLAADEAMEGMARYGIVEWCDALERSVQDSESFLASTLSSATTVAAQCEELVSEAELSFLFDGLRRVFRLGYRVDEGALDEPAYDLMASEARSLSLVAMALGGVPTDHWLHLSRPFRAVLGRRVLQSWSGTGFEYLMPSLFFRTYDDTMLRDACVNAVDVQRAHGKANGTPWGVSESAFALRGADGEYQYRAFGVPDLALRRDTRNHVVAPYASLMALSYRPQAVVENLRSLEGQQARGIYGMYDAVDFTPARAPLGKHVSVVRTYMAHHQGMALAALGNTLARRDLQSRLHADPRIAAIEPALYERTPVSGPLEPPRPTRPTRASDTAAAPVEAWSVRRRAGAPLAWPLSNGRYHMVVDDRGGGRSRWGAIALSRWRSDPVLAEWGTWTYVTDLETGESWSVNGPDGGSGAPAAEVRTWPDRVRFQRTESGVRCTLDVTVDPDRDVELWRLELVDVAGRPRRLAVTRCTEPVLTTEAADRRHPAFAKLFVQASGSADGTVEVSRRTRSPHDPPVTWRHEVRAPQGSRLAVTAETSRERFLGRWGSYSSPAALRRSTELPAVMTYPIDPVVAQRVEVTLQPDGSSRLAFVASAGATAAEARDEVTALGTLDDIDQAFERSAVRAGKSLVRLGFDGRRWRTAVRLLSALTYLRPGRSYEQEAPPPIGMNGLWRFGVSGDLPILLLRLHHERSEELVDMALQAQVYARERGVGFDVVLLNEHDTGYEQPLAARLRRLIAARHAEPWIGRNGGLHFVSAGSLSRGDLATLVVAAGVVLDSGKGTVAEQLEHISSSHSELPRFRPGGASDHGLRAQNVSAEPSSTGMEALRFENGHGGFTEDGRSYVIRVSAAHPTPAPWVNVLANERFGTLVSESGASTTWCLNSGENRLTPWFNDPLRDPTGEAVYLRDEETAAVWTPTPGPAPPSEGTQYTVTHEAASTTFEHVSHSLHQRLRVHVSPDAPVKLVDLELRDLSGRQRRFTATYALDWVLGVDRDGTRPYIVSDYDLESHAVLAMNPYHLEHPARAAFLAADRPVHGVTSDRQEFYGAGGLTKPEALGRIGLSGRVGTGPDPVAALQVHVNVEANGTSTARFLIGQGDDRQHATELAKRFIASGAALADLEKSRSNWDDLLGTLSVRTPDPAMDLLVNRWLLHQVIGCRFWGRTATYQSSGAIGFRDQLQDSLALLHTAPYLTRTHLLTAAAHQFPEGDVLHWWHPPAARGVRTRISDDLVWLPYATAAYVEATNDTGVLDEEVPFLHGAVLGPNEDERYAEYSSGGGTATLLEHGLRALDHASRKGPRGLPLIGTGDWNDGFDRVGRQGRGESVWLAWFLIATLNRFAPLCRLRGLDERAQELEDRAEGFRSAVEESAWDGDRYLRGFYDDGSPLGASGQPECAIDVIAQAWSVLSQAGDPGRARLSMRSADEHLVRDADGLVLLFTPPFTGRGADPGYIRAYPPGVRENGGQYTHGAIWAAWALAQLGDGRRAHELFEHLSPMRHSMDPESAALYRLEPYVVAADIGGHPPHVGRGGWSWYTGSAAWLYRLAVEGILGISRRGNELIISPRTPPSWPGYELEYRVGKSLYRVSVKVSTAAAAGEPLVVLDGVPLPDGRIPLRDDGTDHHVEVSATVIAEAGVGMAG